MDLFILPNAHLHFTMRPHKVDLIIIRMKIDRLHKLLTSTQKSYFEINKTGNYHDLTVPGFVIRYSFNIVC